METSPVFSVTILGCGSSGGVPRVGAGWGACDPSNPRNRRRRCSILLRSEEGTVLVDTSPDLREQLLEADVTWLDAVLYTHDHADHTHGIDDLRPLVIAMRRRIPVYLDARTATLLHTRFGYCFHTPPDSDYPPILEEHRIVAGHPFEVAGLEVLPIALVHGGQEALGFRVGGFAYTPDVSAIPEEAVAQLRDLDLWIIDALRLVPHPSHFHLDAALGWIERLAPRRAILTNLHTDLDYAWLAARLPAHVEPAFDGMTVAGLRLAGRARVEAA